MNYDLVVDECLVEMFKRVGLKYPNPKFTNQPDWYTKRTWSEDEEDDFRLWMKQHLKKRCRWTNRTINKEIAFFLLMWGWKTRLKKENKKKCRI